ncbi:MAG: GNAT family N-acetyltransferase [bacterium]|jgi:ribosomal protein S18 acetylase RimI-like enzyme|nr:GNAT family N-acetyltransferase [bacterium]
MKQIAKRSECKKLIIREAIGSDYQALCDLFDQVDEFHRKQVPHIFRKPEGESRSSDYVENLMADANTGLFVAQANERLVGLICCFMRETPDIPILVPRKYVYIDNLVVDKNHRRQGIGMALLQKAHTWAIEHEIDEIELNVWQFNDDAIRLYEKLGYKTTLLRMSKILE